MLTQAVNISAVIEHIQISPNWTLIPRRSKLFLPFSSIISRLTTRLGKEAFWTKPAPRERDKEGERLVLFLADLPDAMI